MSPRLSPCPRMTLFATTSALFASLASCTIASEPAAPTYTTQSIYNTYEDTRSKMRKFGSFDAPSTSEGTFRLTSYNIENLFDAHDDPELVDRNEDIDDTKPEHELIATAIAIHKVNADVICFQEIESEQALLEYRDTYLADMGYDHVVSIDAGNARGIENAVLSRYPISSFKNWPNKPLGGVHPELYGTQPNWYAGEPIAFRRSPLMVDIQIPTDASSDSKEDSWTLTLFVMHHKSGRFNTYWREAEAKGTLELINEVLKAHPDRPIMLVGDFNAMITDDSVKTYLNNGFTDIFADHDQTDEIITHESGRRIDLILANQSAMDRLDPSSAFVLGTSARPEGTSWRDLDTFDGYAADHYPLSVDISK